jgi:xylulokinase
MTFYSILSLCSGSPAPKSFVFEKRMPEAYNKTTRISLVSSFFASIFLGKVAPIDISDLCGMNLWDIKTGTWDRRLMNLASGGNPDGLAERLGPIREDGGGSIGYVSPYLVKRFGFDPQCSIAPFTGDNPATILALPLRPMDAVVSLGTSTTFLMSTPHYKHSPSVHFFNHPTTPGLYMFMLCYKNGGLAREQVRDSINGNATDGGRTVFDKAVTNTPPLGQQKLTDPLKLGMYFPRPEIVPSVRAGIWR